MAYHTLEPEVAGGWGANAVCTRTPGKPIVVQKLHYEFDGWLGDELLESTPCFIVTERLASEISQARLTGAGFDDVEITASDQFREIYPERELPKFVWLKVEGKAGQDDFGIGPALRLVVSDQALALLKERGVLNAASIGPFDI